MRCSTFDPERLFARSFDLARRGATSIPGEGGNQWLLPHVHGEDRHIPKRHVFEEIMQLVDWIRTGKPSIVTAEHACLWDAKTRIRCPQCGDFQAEPSLRTHRFGRGDGHVVETINLSVFRRHPRGASALGSACKSE